MMKVFAVVHTVGGFAREDAPNISVAGIFTDEKIADIVKKSAGVDAKVIPIIIDEVLPGYIDFAKQVLNIDLKQILKEKELGFEQMDEFDLDCLMTAEEFMDYEDSGAIIPDDGHGYWATDKQVSKVSCWAEKPEWATHVCWYNK